MFPVEIALLVFTCVFGGAVIGMFLRVVLPEHHLSDETRDVIKVGMGLVATLSALVLGLVIATAKSSYDTQNEAIKYTAAKVLLLDRMLANYGPETKETRDLLRRTLASRVEQIWPEDSRQPGRLVSPQGVLADEWIDARILQLSPKNEAQRWLRSQALQISTDIVQTRWLIFGGLGRTVPVLFLAVVVFWLTIIFGSFGLLAPRNGTVVAVLFLCAVSVAGSMFLILEMDQPFEGLMKISSAPLRYAISQLGQ